MDTDKQITALQALMRQQEREAKARELYLLYRINALEKEIARIKNAIGDK